MKKISQSIITKRVLWTLFFLFIYCLGNQLVLPFVDLKNANIFGGAIGSLAFSSAMMGGNLRSMSLFSVGLSPWMSAMILWQMFSFSKKMGLKNLPIEIQDRRRMYLALGIAIVQSLAVSLNLPIVSGVNASLAIFMNTILLIAGTFFLVWLSDLNSLFGIGGSIVILMASMMANLPYQIMDSIEKLGIGWNVLLPLILFSLIFRQRKKKSLLLKPELSLLKAAPVLNTSRSFLPAVMLCRNMVRASTLITTMVTVHLQALRKVIPISAVQRMTMLCTSISRISAGQELYLCFA